MKTEWCILFVDDRGKVLSKAAFSSREKRNEVRYCLQANCGLTLECVERVSYMDDSKEGEK